MDILLYFIGFFIGIFIGPFTLTQIGIILFFGIPHTRRLEKNNILKTPNPIMRNSIISIVVLSIIFIAISCILAFFWWNMFIGYMFAIIMTFLFSIGKMGANRNNTSDYFESNKNWITVIEKDI